MQQILLMRQDLAKSNLKSYGAILTFPPCNLTIPTTMELIEEIDQLSVRKKWTGLPQRNTENS